MLPTRPAPSRGRARLAARAALALLVTLSACDGDESSPPPPPPTIGISLPTAALSLAAGQSGTANVVLARGGNYTGAVGLALEGAPAGVSGSFSPATLSGATTTSTLTLTTTAAATPGIYPLTVRASGQGVTAQTATLTLTVTAPPGFAISLTPTTVSLEAGASSPAVAVALTRAGGFAGAVELLLEGAPAGVTASFNPASIAAGATGSVLTLSSANTTAAGTYPLTVRARAQGLADRTATLTLTVTRTAQPAFTLALAPTTLSVQQGASGSVRVSVARSGGFTGPVSLSWSGLPVGTTAQLPAGGSLAGDTATLTIAVAAPGSIGDAPLPGAYTLTLTGRAQGQPDRSATLALTVTAAPGGYALSLSADTVRLQAGGTGRTNIRIARSGGFAGSIGLGVTGLPTGLTAAVVPALTNGDSASVTLTATAGLAPGTYPLSVRGVVSGMVDVTRPLIAVVSAAPQPGFTLSVLPASVSVQAGSSVAASVNITRSGGFSAGVTLSATSAPAGLTATFVPNPSTTNASNLTVNAPAGQAAGSYTLTIRGSAAGLTDQTTTLAVTVTQAPVGGNPVNWSICDPSDAPIFVAYQNENGPWTRVTPSNNIYTFSVGQRGGVAIVEPDYSTDIFYGSAAELAAFGRNSCVLEGEGGKRLTGSVAGVGAFDMVQVQLGSSGVLVLPGSPTFTLSNVPDGPLDLIATRSAAGGSGFLVNKLILRRGLNLPNNGVIPTLDFGAAEAFDPEARRLTLSGLGGDEAAITMSYFTANNDAFVLGGAGLGYFLGMPSDSATRTYYGVPSARRQAGDLHMLFVMALPPGGSGSFDTFRGSISFFRDLVDRTVAVGPVLSQPTVTTLAGGPYVRLRAQFARQGEYDDFATVRFEQDTREVMISATAAYFGGSFATWDLAIPDLSGAGFNALWALAPGIETEWYAGAYGWSGTGLPLLEPTEGAVFQIAQRSGKLTP